MLPKGNASKNMQKGTLCYNKVNPETQRAQKTSQYWLIGLLFQTDIYFKILENSILMQQT